VLHFQPLRYDRWRQALEVTREQVIMTILCARQDLNH